eukprot:CAMPEP_0174384704 /NCGR_PEP_ID=MMETSP0811_2-20130205/126093_1 /TAXON_ID=73025 ORGANISM="Eutreptiella gymnastica-like, Strain CCMP1594" /NCGR_SAMPLE_ID=MMETSP0811_2 /ASSEMBLY_ACC=CAM_ASM_000667 /LENGTH=140 /DNA_ID=CAMNT_0015538743 /DNA_START=502 /DNA_END=924 /DNA_ORIENTATION=-
MSARARFAPSPSARQCKGEAGAQALMGKGSAFPVPPEASSPTGRTVLHRPPVMTHPAPLCSTTTGACTQAAALLLEKALGAPLQMNTRRVFDSTRDLLQQRVELLSIKRTLPSDVDDALVGVEPTAQNEQSGGTEAPLGN